MADIILDPDSLVERLGFIPARSRKEAGLRERIEVRFGAGYDPQKRRFLLAVAEKIKACRGITPDGLTALMGKPFPEVAEAVALLSAAGIVTTDILQRCSVNMK